MDRQLFVTKSSMPPFDEYCNEIKELWESHWLTNMGIKHQEFKSKLEEIIGVDNIELLTNGHMAIELTLQALKLKGEVITTPFTFASTTHAIVRNGLTPVFCDIDKDTYTIDSSKIEELVTEKTSAILPVHVYGNICNVEEIQKIADRHGLKVVYDAAHAFGEKYNGRSVGQFGDASCFSFHATKVFNSIEGGCVSYKNKYIGNTLYDLINFGIHGEDSVTFIGANAKMNEFCAAMGICNLRYLDSDISKRESIYNTYLKRLSSVNGIHLNRIQPNVKSNYAYVPIVINEEEYGTTRDELYSILKSNNIFARKYFYPLTSDFECYNTKYDSKLTPVAKYISERVLTLPIYPDLELDSVNRICNIIENTGKNE